MLEDKQEILNKNYFLNKRKDAHKKNKFLKVKNRLFLLGIFLGIIIIALIYFISPYSNIYHISVFDNIYYSDDEIRDIAKIDDKDKYLLVNLSSLSRRLKADPLIENVDIYKKDNNLIEIHVKEKKIIGYIYEEGNAYILLEDDTRIPLTQDNMRFIYDVPLIEGYSKEELLSLEKGFGDVEVDVIKEISEIHKYPFSYDEKMMEVIMKDGNYIFVSSIGLDLLHLSSYYTAISKLELGGKKACIYLDEVTETLQYRKCPWEPEEIIIPEEKTDE